MVNIQHKQFPLQTHVHILGGHGVQVAGDTQLNASALQAVPKDLTDGEKVSGKLMHVCSRAVAKLVEVENGT